MRTWWRGAVLTAVGFLLVSACNLLFLYLKKTAEAYTAANRGRLLRRTRAARKCGGIPRGRHGSRSRETAEKLFPFQIVSTMTNLCSQRAKIWRVPSQIFAINFGVKEVNTLKLGMGGSLTLIMLSLTPPAVTTTIKVKEAS